jgi:hypothetical protein
MKNKIVISGLAALGLSALTATACIIEGLVQCPNGTSQAGIRVYIVGGPETTTSASGLYALGVDGPGDYTVCVDPSTVMDGLKLKGNKCAGVTATGLDIAWVDTFDLDGPKCENTPPPGGCWLTGGGTIGKTKGVPDYSYGGVVNPGCSAVAAGGGNFNVLRHDGLHFKGLEIVVDGCAGVPDKAPKVDVNVINFHGTGTVVGIEGNPTPLTKVNFTAQAIDSGEPGAGKDALLLMVVNADNPSEVLLLISTDAGAPVPISTGNLQIHTTSCN